MTFNLDSLNETLGNSSAESGSVSMAYFLFHWLWRVLFLLAMISGLFGNIFISINVLRDAQMRNTNFFFVLTLVFVDLLVILSYITVREIVFALQSNNIFLLCFPSVWNFVVNYTASNYILLFLCYEKFILIILPFEKAKYLSMRVKVIFMGSLVVCTAAVLLLKIKDVDSSSSETWCQVRYPLVSEWQSDLIDVAFFTTPILVQIVLYIYMFCTAQKVSQRLEKKNAQARSTKETSAQPNAASTSKVVQDKQPNKHQNPQLRVAKTCLVATFVRFILWSPYVVHLVRLACLEALGLVTAGTRSEVELAADYFFSEMTIIASCTNPIVFIVMSPPLKKRLKEMLDCMKRCCCCCCANRGSQTNAEELGNDNKAQAIQLDAANGNNPNGGQTGHLAKATCA